MQALNSPRTWHITYSNYEKWSAALGEIAWANGIGHVPNEFGYEHWSDLWREGYLPTEALLHTITHPRYYTLEPVEQEWTANL